jgi:hypothetical protein
MSTLRTSTKWSEVEIPPEQSAVSSNEEVTQFDQMRFRSHVESNRFSASRRELESIVHLGESGS